MSGHSYRITLTVESVASLVNSILVNKRPSLREARAETQGRYLETGPDAEATEQSCLMNHIQ